MAVTLFANATEYIANAVTLTRGKISDITNVGIYVSTNPNVIPTVTQFTHVQLVDGTGTPPLPPLAVAGEVDVVTKVGPGSAASGPWPAVPAGDLAALTPGSYQVWILIVTASEAIIRKIDTLTLT
jgi:hypothetical protein